MVKLKHYRSILTFLTFLSDLSAILLSCLIAYRLWDIIGPFLSMEMYEKLHIFRYSLLFGLTVITILIGFEVNGLYKSQRSILNVREFELILRTWIMAMGVTMVILYMADELYFSRGMFLITWIIILLFLIIERYSFFKFNSYLKSLGIGETVVLIYGTGLLAKRLVTKFNQSPKLGYQIAGFIDDDPKIQEFLGIRVLGGFNELKDIIHKVNAQRIFVARSTLEYEKVMEILDICRNTGCSFQAVPNVYDTVLERVRISDIEGIPLFKIQEPEPSSLTIIIKRCFDIFWSVILLLIFFPPVIVLLIFRIFFRTSPLLTKSAHIGRNGKVFQLLGFNHRKKNSVSESGRRARLFKLDWYPQLINIFKGEMSFVGPRPQCQDTTEKVSELTRHKLALWPGLTGLWDVAAKKAVYTFEDKDLDIYYIQNQSLIMDIIILLRKILTMLKG